MRPVVRTTPEAIDLQRMFREMLDAGNRSVALEATSHASVLHRLDRVRFDALVFTNLSQDHLDFHESMEDYFAAKRRLFTGAAPPPAAVNIGDEWGRRLADELEKTRRAPLITFGFADDAEIRPEQLVLDASGARFTRAGSRSCRTCADASTSRTSSARSPPGSCSTSTRTRSRLGCGRSRAFPAGSRPSTRGSRSRCVVDYSHKPDALDNVLRTARELADGRVIVVFGAGGDRDREKRPLMGRVARDLADVAIVTSDNPRSEDPLAIIQDVLQGTGMDVEIDPDRRSAIARAVELAQPGDVVVIAGKGHEQGQEIGGEKIAFDDRDVAREALAAA